MRMGMQEVDLIPRAVSITALFIGFLAQYASAGTLRPGDFERFLSHGGRNRSYIVHVPPGCDDTKPIPLVIVLHGGGGNAAGAMRMTGMSAKSDRERFIVVYPNGTGALTDRMLTWNAGNCCGYAFDRRVDDVGFIRALIARLESDFKIDPARIYVTGMSNGAMMAYRVACEISDKVAAIAPVSGALNCDCRPKKPISVIIFHGTADKNVLYEGGHPVKREDKRDRIDKPVSHAVAFWVGYDGCSPTPIKQEKGNITIETYPGGREGTEVVLYTIKGGGHAWPGGTGGPVLTVPLLRMVEPMRRTPAIEPRSISATELIWDFFKRHPKKVKTPMTCPKCGSDKNTIPIVYGLADENLLRRSNRGEIKLGGFVVTGRDPKWYCKSCRSKW